MVAVLFDCFFISRINPSCMLSFKGYLWISLIISPTRRFQAGPQYLQDFGLFLHGRFPTDRLLQKRIWLYDYYNILRPHHIKEFNVFQNVEILLYSKKYRRSQFFGIYIIITLEVLLNLTPEVFCNGTGLMS